MSGRKSGSRTMRKPAKRRSAGKSLLRFFFNSASTLAIAAGELVARNPVLTGGATAFLVVMGFVSANALWYQPEAHDAVFFRTRPDFVFRPTPRAVLPGTAAAKPAQPAQPPQPMTTVAEIAAAPTPPAPKAAPVPVPAQPAPGRLPAADVIDDMLPALAPKADLEVARLQQRLALLGVYKGPVDGFTGPQTREALERWRALQGKLGVQAAADAAPPDDTVTATIVAPTPRPRPQPAVAHAEARPKPELASLSGADRKPASSVSSQDIVRVQAGLKAFGNDRVPVDGHAGKVTQDAVRDFQKLFGLPVTGEIDAALIAKMREIGLIG